MTAARSMWMNKGLPPDNFGAGRYGDSLKACPHTRRPRVLVACERSAVVRDWLRLYGVDAWSCDIRPCDKGGPHLQGDVANWLYDPWDAVVAFPPCQYLSRVNVAGRRKYPERERDALAFVQMLWLSPTNRLIVENPVGAVWQLLGRPTQQIQPYQFGHPFSKITCLWMRGVGMLSPTHQVACGAKWTEVASTSRIRSRTFSGIGQALAAAVVDSLP